MEKGYTNNGLLSTLQVLDVYIEMQTDALKTYRKLTYQVSQQGAKSILNWLFDAEEMGLRRAAVRKQRILEQNPELNEDDVYTPRKVTGVSKMGWDSAHLPDAGPLDILRYAIKNEVRAKQFFRRKAGTVQDPAQRMMYLAAVSDQDYQVRCYDAKREELMQKQVNNFAVRFVKMAV